ncbi:hypothetical protein P389DRAFT_193773 [Cystobasidium minutum MCA 4210]|uniref:mitochondrial 37S ribosomal protein mS37 n=1 Tax=Cystobasidium minutum MCA 4210 TaxID=1397322 RepID=UPI0034D01071|eukprot:jgi/Rhomi1/193773/gm1.1987_g
MKIPKLKVRSRSLAQATPCAAELSAMLGCWAQSNDKMNAGACASAAQALEKCMATSMAGRRGKVRKPTINYHLARLGKNFD